MEELTAVKDLVLGAGLAAAAQEQALWCVGRLQPLYDQFCATYENRFRTEILRLEQNILTALDKTARGAAKEAWEQLHGLHTRLGMEGSKPKQKSA